MNVLRTKRSAQLTVLSGIRVRHAWPLLWLPDEHRRTLFATAAIVVLAILAAVGVPRMPSVSTNLAGIAATVTAPVLVVLFFSANFLFLLRYMRGDYVAPSGAAVSAFGTDVAFSALFVLIWYIFDTSQHDDISTPHHHYLVPLMLGTGSLLLTLMMGGLWKASGANLDLVRREHDRLVLSLEKILEVRYGDVDEFASLSRAALTQLDELANCLQASRPFVTRTEAVDEAVSDLRKLERALRNEPKAYFDQKAWRDEPRLQNLLEAWI